MPKKIDPREDSMFTAWHTAYMDSGAAAHNVKDNLIMSREKALMAASVGTADADLADLVMSKRQGKSDVKLPIEIGRLKRSCVQAWSKFSLPCSFCFQFLGQWSLCAPHQEAKASRV